MAREAGPPRDSGGFPRRDFLKGSGVAVAATALASATPEELAAQAGSAKVVGKGPTTMELHVNGAARKVTVEPRVTLLNALRNELQLTGCKDVCDDAVCGACTVLLDGLPVYGCTKLAVECVGAKVTTVESLHSATATDPVVTNFCKHDGMQCGFCTPGFVMAVRGFCDQHPGATLDDCRAGLGGNICRCGTYDGVLKAAYDTAQATTKGA